MASTRIKDLSATATQAAADDYLAIDGATNGTRKIKPEDLRGGGSSVSPYTSNPAALGSASPGSSDNYSRGDHVHPKPSASDVGAIPAPSSPSSGQYLTYNGSAWGATTLSTATTNSDGLMSSTDKAHLEAVYSDYSSSLVALLGEEES